MLDSPLPRSVTVATKVSAADADRLAAACEQDGVTKSAFLHQALVAALDQREGRDAQVDIDLVAADADGEQGDLHHPVTRSR